MEAAADLTLKLSDLDEVAQVARDLLPSRQSRIVEGRIDGVHYFVAIMREAKELVLRRKTWRSRRAT